MVMRNPYRAKRFSTNCTKTEEGVFQSHGHDVLEYVNGISSDYLDTYIFFFFQYTRNLNYYFILGVHTHTHGFDMCVNIIEIPRERLRRRLFNSLRNINFLFSSHWITTSELASGGDSPEQHRRPVILYFILTARVHTGLSLFVFVFVVACLHTSHDQSWCFGWWISDFTHTHTDFIQKKKKKSADRYRIGKHEND